MQIYRRPFTPDSFVWMGSEDISLPPFWLGTLRLSGRAVVILIVAYAIHLVMDWATTQATARDGLMIGVLSVLLLAYALLIAVPFMPGIEIGISLLVLKGAAIAPFVYLATVLGLLLAFAAGRFLPHGWLHNILADLQLKRACALVNKLAPMTGEERLAHLTDRLPAWLKPLIGPWRYPLLAALINVPGSAMIGGGGGIAFTAGFSRLFHTGWTALTFALAVAPVPLIVWWSGDARMLP